MAGPFGSRVAILLVFNCFVDDLDLEHDEKLDVEFHPIGVPIGSHHQKYFVGAIVFNSGIVLALAAVLLLGSTVQARADGARICPPPSEYQARFRFPSFPFLPFEFLAQGTALAAAHCAFFPSRGEGVTQPLGVLVLAALALGPPIIWWVMLRGPRFHALSMPDPWLAKRDTRTGSLRTRAYRLLYGSTVWVSTVDYFVERHGMMFEMYCPEDQFACNARNFLVSGVLVLYLVGLNVVRPYLSPLTHVLQCAIALQNAVAIALIAAGLAFDDHPGLLRGGAVMLVVSACFQFAFLCCEILAYSFDICYVGRRQRGWAAVREPEVFMLAEVGSAPQSTNRSEHPEAECAFALLTPAPVALDSSVSAHPAPVVGLDSTSQDWAERRASTRTRKIIRRRRGRGRRGSTLNAALTPAESPLLQGAAPQPGVAAAASGVGRAARSRSMTVIRHQTERSFSATSPAAGGSGAATPPPMAIGLSPTPVSRYISQQSLRPRRASVALAPPQRGAPASGGDAVLQPRAGRGRRGSSVQAEQTHI
eukprot:TRINITY_DN11790_c0_g1_i8.p2 TRINITY_DN11790_c0_g1~~TRINITY_DN11790_c0_g1_i8.p2  ORF type:complete len:535 (+),score=97.87 TRINITY_DN11790_c0_g1_i8:3416-5020(+)